MDEARKRYVATKRAPKRPKKNPRNRRAIAKRREPGAEQSYQLFGSVRLGTLADVWPGARA
jgi:hypothetical protein